MALLPNITITGIVSRSVRSKSRNDRPRAKARRIRPWTIRDVRKHSGENSVPMMADNEIPLPKLARKCAAFDADNNRIVSEGVQRDREDVNTWCRNILADQPPRAQSSDQGKEVSGQVGVPTVSIRTRSAVLRARVSTRDTVNRFQVFPAGIPDVFEAFDCWPAFRK